MKSQLLSLFAVLAISFPLFAAEPRLVMVEPPPEEDELALLLDAVSESCEEKDFRTFIKCFVPSRQPAVRAKMEDHFICGDVCLDIVEHFIISHDEDELVFGLKYEWASHSGKATLFSKMVAKRCDGVLKLDSEQVRKVSFSEQLIPRSDGLFKDCPGGICGLPARFPENGGEDMWLPKDVIRVPGPSCLNGNCGF